MALIKGTSGKGIIFNFHTDPTWNLKFSYNISNNKVKANLSLIQNNFSGDSSFGYKIRVGILFLDNNNNMIDTKYGSFRTGYSDHSWNFTDIPIPSKATRIGFSGECYGCHIEGDTILKGKSAYPLKYYIGTVSDNILRLRSSSSLDDYNSLPSDLIKEFSNTSYWINADGTIQDTNNGNDKSKFTCTVSGVYISDLYNSISISNTEVQWYYHNNRSKTGQYKVKTNLDTNWITPDSNGKLSNNLDVIFESSNNNVATISKDGTLTAKGIGTAKITCKVNNYNLSCTSTVNIKQGLDSYYVSYNRDIPITNIDHNKVSISEISENQNKIGRYTLYHHYNDNIDSTLANSRNYSVTYHDNSPQFDKTIDIKLDTNNNVYTYGYISSKPGKYIMNSYITVSGAETNPDGSSSEYTRTISYPYYIVVVGHLKLSLDLDTNSSKVVISKYTDKVRNKYKVSFYSTQILETNGIENIMVPTLTCRSNVNGTIKYNYINNDHKLKWYNKQTDNYSIYETDNDKSCYIEINPKSIGVSPGQEYNLLVQASVVVSYGSKSITLTSDEIISNYRYILYSIPKNQYAIFHSEPIMREILKDSNIPNSMLLATLGNDITDTSYKKYMNVRINGDRNLCFTFYNYDNTTFTPNIWNVSHPRYESRKYIIEIYKADNSQLIKRYSIDPNTSTYSIELKYNISPNVIEPLDHNGNITLDSPLYIKFYIETYDINGNVVYTEDDYNKISDNNKYVFSTNDYNSSQNLYIRYTPLNSIDDITNVGIKSYNESFTINWLHMETCSRDYEILDDNGNIIGYEDRGITTDYHISVYIDSNYVYKDEFLCNNPNYDKSKHTTLDNYNTNISMLYNKSGDYSIYFDIENGILPMRYYSISITPCCYYNSNIHRLGPEYSTDNFIYLFSRLGKPRIIYPISGYGLDTNKNNHSFGPRFAIELPEDPDYEYLTEEQKSNYKYGNLKINRKSYNSSDQISQSINRFKSYNISNIRAGTTPNFYNNPKAAYCTLNYTLKNHTDLNNYRGYTFLKANNYDYSNNHLYTIYSVSIEKFLPIPTSDYNFNLWSEDSDIVLLYRFSDWYPITDTLANFTDNPIEYNMTKDEFIKAEEIFSINRFISRIYPTYRTYKLVNNRPTTILLDIEDENIINLVDKSIDDFRGKVISLNDIIKLYNGLITMTDNYNNLYKNLYNKDLPKNIAFPYFYNENIENELKTIITAETNDSNIEVSLDSTKGYNYFLYIIKVIINSLLKED